MIAPHRIKFLNKYSTDFDLICGAAFDPDNGGVESFFNKETLSSNVYDGSRRNVHHYRYSEVMTVQFTLIKNDYTHFSDEENRKIIAWLTGSNRVEELTVYKDDSEVISYRLIGNIISVEQYKLSTNKVIGYVVTFENISPYAYSPVKTLTKTITTPEEIIINCQTDVYEKYLYPKIQLIVGDSLYLEVDENPLADTYVMLDNAVYKYNNNYYVKVNGQKQTLSGIFSTDIENQTADVTTYGKYYLCLTDLYIYKGIINDNSIYTWERLNRTGAGFEIKNTYYENGQDVSVCTVITDCHKHEVIMLDGENRIVSSSETPMRIIGDSFNWEWMYLIPGKNTITVSGGCTITFQWVEPIKIGNL